MVCLCLVEHCLWYMSALKGLKKKEAKDKITSLLDTVNLTDSAHKS